LRAWWAALEGIGAPVVQYARPGLAAAEVAARLRAAGLPASVEIVTWFGFHDGVEQLSPEASRDMPFSHHLVVPFGLLISLDEALERYREWILFDVNPAYGNTLPAGSLPEYLGWLPIIDDQGYYTVAHCGPDPDEASPVTVWYPDDGLRQAAGSVAEVVRAWTQLVVDGTWALGPQGRGWDWPDLRETYPAWRGTSLL